MNDKLYIPKRINVGYQLRQGTYTGKLGYVIYWDDKGKLRKENSWQSWRHKPDSWEVPEFLYEWVDGKRVGTKNPNAKQYGDVVKPEAFDNVPTEGFVLNKKAGGVGSGWGWHDRVEKCRVYDPRGFEFEISIPNLLFILTECNSVKGKGLVGQFVYSWSGTELVLLPVSSNEYKECLEYTNLQAKKVSLRDVKVGYNYKLKNGSVATYLGKDYFRAGSSYIETSTIYSKYNHIFYTEGSYDEFTMSVNLAEEIGPCPNFNDICDKFKKSNKCARKIIKLDIDKEYNAPPITKKDWGRYDRHIYLYTEDNTNFHLYDISAEYHYQNHYHYGFNGNKVTPAQIQEYLGCYTIGKHGTMVKVKGKTPKSNMFLNQLRAFRLVLDDNTKIIKKEYNWVTV